MRFPHIDVLFQMFHVEFHVSRKDEEAATTEERTQIGFITELEDE